MSQRSQLPDLDDFAAEARQLARLGRRAAVRRPSGASAPTRSRSSRTGPRSEERAETDRIRAYEQAKYDAGWGALTWPEEYGGRDLPTSYAPAVPAGGGGLRRPPPHRDVLRDPAAGRARRRPVGHRRAAGALRARHAAHRPDRLPALLRDRGRLRPRRGAHPGRRARRRRLGARRPQGVDLRGAGRRPRRRGHPHRPGRRPSTPGSPSSWCRWTHPASRCGRSAR